MKRYLNPEQKEWTKILERPLFNASDLTDKVQSILNDIKSSGGHAIRKYTEKFDGVFIRNFSVTEEEIETASRLLDADLKDAIEIAARNISLFHAAQKPELKKIETTPGVVCWQKAVAIEKVGLYIPGGSAPLFSTVLMLAIPAKIAGCKEIVLCSPPDREGKIHPAILFAAQLVGVTKIFKLGGVQAIGAMAYGADCIPKVDKIFGPGNQFVMAAKQLVSINDVAIDMPAGPSEVAIMADGSANAAFIAADLLSQAEHGPDSQVVLVTNSESLVDDVEIHLASQLAELNRKEIAAKALGNSVAIVFQNEDEMISLINEYAPEHLIISMENYSEIAEKIINAGSVFLGSYTPESAGDYASGTNHTLPTNGWARSFSGVNIDSFIKKITFQEISREGIKNLGSVIETMAAAEQLDAHRNAVTLRLKELNDKK
ncbi:MAG: histidinol dehydrogenase [Bacteroidetes bacterium GWF2_42_66]|nr:MAG: histidinol dehydrogenase [Bacteroidetes bacterium GWA2_42_15]OFY00973.1 MAG: histidinol dehydrogenase [Bacteroidetes bacterium GWE2_42_39]OFY41813.1 MAG: histidinol dehydrogenase [Bacteroidetes bacterium GWF2_42_66]HBL78018.1 histidinol dehydrogenase [Prolixibacteraceae bacterium]HCR89840.1 histidinol dehydrogenase [Prolixibacteraceae bacterium]